MRTSEPKPHWIQQVASVLRFRSSYISPPHDRTNFGIGTLAIEEAVCRPRQTEIFPQCLALVCGTIQSPPLQFRDDLLDEVVKPAGQVRELDRKAVRSLGRDPFLH